MSVRARMTMRCSTERETPTVELNRYQQPITATVHPLTDSPCYWQAQSRQFVTTNEKLVAITTHVLLMPLGADVDEDDRITSITDRRGRVLKAGKLRIMPGGVRRETHLEVRCEEYG